MAAPLVAATCMTSGVDVAPVPQPSGAQQDMFTQHRSEYLESLLRLRRFYRNCIRAVAIDRLEEPVYQAYSDAELAEEFVSDEDRGAAMEDRRAEAVTHLAEMKATVGLLKADCNQLSERLGDLFDGKANDAVWLRELCQVCCDKVEARMASELDHFVQASDAGVPKQKLQEQINAEAMTFNSALSFKKAGVRNARNLFTAQIRPAVRKATDVVAERGLTEAFKASGSYISAFWSRLNGLPVQDQAALPLGMQMPRSNAKACWESIEEAQLRIPQLEKELVDASKAREQRVRRAPIELRGVLAFEMQELDADVLRCGRSLAMCTLDIQLDYLYASLEDEVRQFFDAPLPAGAQDLSGLSAQALLPLAPRRGSTEELNLLIAQFSLLCARHRALQEALERQGSPGLLPAFDDELKGLAEDISEMRVRLGIPDQTVFGGSGFSLRKLQLRAKEYLGTARDGVDSFVLGVRMLGSDLGYVGSLFGRASLGNTLKPREVSAMRRTLKDVLVFVPFTIILIIPLTPLGHVLVFGFIQRYFPDFFPSQFNSKRQEVVKRYEQLRKELFKAQAAADEAEDEKGFQNAKAAIARLTPPAMLSMDLSPPTASATSLLTPSSTDASSRAVGGSSDMKLKDLKKKVLEAEVDALTFGSDSEEDLERIGTQRGRASPAPAAKAQRGGKRPAKRRAPK